MDFCNNFRKPFNANFLVRHRNDSGCGGSCSEERIKSVRADRDNDLHGCFCMKDGRMIRLEYT